MLVRRPDWLPWIALLVGCGSSSPGGGVTPKTEDLCANVTCRASDECHVAGTCDGATGRCRDPAAPDGTACRGGTCSGGACTAASGLCAGVVCEALDACHPAGACDPATGACVSEPASDGTPCTGGVCSDGVCTAVGGSCTDGAANAAETDVDCGGGLCAGCVNGKACIADRDCMSGFCGDGHCAALVTALVADPGPQRAVAPGVRVVLDGTRSRSPSGAIATWSWVQTDGPAVQLGGADGAYPSFDAPAGPAEAVLSFTLTVGDGITTAAAPLKILVRAADRPEETTSLGLILDAMSEGRIDRHTAVTYLAFSAYGDPRLPAEFGGTEAVPSGTTAKHIIAAEFPTLSPAAQEVVRPFLLPPAAPGSWASRSGTQGLRSAAAAPEQGWAGVSSAHLVIWFRPSLANGYDIAKRLSKEAERKIWPALEALFADAHMPVLSDAAVNLVNGGTHGKLNVYLVGWVPGHAYGMETPYGDAPAPSYIELDQALPFSGRPMGLSEGLAHEMTHSCQDSYKQSEPYFGHRWIYEGTASWAQDYVYPSTNTEQTYAPYYLNAPWVSLDDDWSLHPYGSYLFFQSVTRPLDDAAFVRRVFENFQSRSALESVEHALPNDRGFEIAWRAFAAAAWNRDPSDDFWALDGLDRGAKVRGPAPVEMQMQGGDDLAYEMDVRVRHLAANYAHVSFPDPTARQIFLYDGYLFRLTWVDSDGGRAIAATPRQFDPLRFPFMSTAVLVKRGAAWERAQAVSGNLFACQDDPAERIDELAIGFGYGFPVPGESAAPEGLKPRLWMSNIGCYRWTGTVSGSTSPSALGPPEQTTAQVTFVRDYRDGMEVLFSVGEGSFTWKTWGTWNDCSYSGEAAWTGSGAQEGMLRFLPQLVDGPGHRGYEGAAYPHLVKYRMTCPDGDGGTFTTEAEKSVVWLNTVNAGTQTVPQVSADGLTATGAADDGNMVYTWSFTSTPGP